MYAGSIPTSASIPAGAAELGVDFSYTRTHSRPPARVVKLVDTRDLKSLGLGHAGSSPAPGTIRKQTLSVYFWFAR